MYLDSGVICYELLAQHETCISVFFPIRLKKLCLLNDIQNIFLAFIASQSLCVIESKIRRGVKLMH